MEHISAEFPQMEVSPRTVFNFANHGGLFVQETCRWKNVLKVRSPTTHNRGGTLLKTELSLMATHLFPFRHLIFENRKSKRERSCKFRNRKAKSMFRVDFNRKALLK
ncbi:hypothetical protein CEXT_609651 [Caerostris extrusa]|uniref:Uncharacterized protein n=1 Tax=Caerostris extrusa TaxID=172846 RepID=A0AAV4PQP4_CAEEX|nr:hypothetical protein CEXT_609651 [Caerostris extrusa]